MHYVTPTASAVAMTMLLLGGCADTPARRASPPEPINLVGVQGARLTMPPRGQGPTVLLFTSTSCPIANGYAPEISRMVEEYRPQGVAFWLVYTERDITPDDARQHLREFDLPCDAVLDKDRTLVELTGATVTPEAAVLSPQGELLYRGRIDDRFPDIGIQHDTASQTELRDALQEVLAGEPVKVARTTAVGCYIE